MPEFSPRAIWKLRIAVRGHDRAAVERFTREIAPLVLTGPPSVTGFAGGRPAVQELALEAIRPGGTLTLVGLSAMGTGTNLPGAVLVRQEKVVRGSYYGSVNPGRDFPLLLDLYMAGRLKLDELVTQTYPLSQINDAYDAMLSGEAARGVILF